MKNRWQELTTWFSDRKLKQKVRSLFVIVLCAYFLVFFVVYQFVLKENTQQYIDNTNMNLLYSMSSNTDSVINNINTVSKWIMSSQEVKDYLKSSAGKTSPSAYQALDSIYNFTINEKQLASIYLLKNDLEYLDISNGRTIVDEEILASQQWRERLEEKAGFYLVATNGGGAFKARDGSPYVSFMRVVNDNQTQKPIGFLVMNYNSNLLSSTYENINSGNKVFGYFDGNGELLSGDETLKALYEEIHITNKVERRLYTHPIANTPFISVVYEQENIFNYISRESIIIVVLFILITITSLVSIGLFISQNITKPVESLVQSMDAVKQGWLKRVSLNIPNDEIGHLKDSYNNMLVEMNRLIDELVEKETAVQRAELEVLQEQIKPHFLYNTLDTIGYLALKNPREEAYDAIETLEMFYRRFLSKGSKDITVAEEVEIVRNYLKLQNLRYRDVFDDTCEVDKNVQDIKVPKLILQPLVENALYHGVRLKGERGVIKVHAYKHEDKLYISVYDSGVGMTQQQIEGLMHEETKSFGLKKTIERIQTYYGVQDVYEIKSKVGYYCEIILKIPLDGKEEIIHVQGDDN